MELRVLGCSGGIGKGRGTTSFLIDEDVLLDAGSGVNQLTLDEYAHIKHIFLSHAHLDHIHTIPLLIDSIFDRIINAPITVYGQKPTIDALRRHIFNWSIWPDFTELPDPEHPVLKFRVIAPYDVIEIGDRSFEAVPVNHTVPAVAYIVRGGSGIFAFSGDTTTNDTLWERLNGLPALDLLIVEVAHVIAEKELCRLSKHYCPQTLATDLKKLRHQPEIYLTHAKPGEEENIFSECSQLVSDRKLHQLYGGKKFTL